MQIVKQFSLAYVHNLIVKNISEHHKILTNMIDLLESFSSHASAHQREIMAWI